MLLPCDSFNGNTLPSGSIFFGECHWRVCEELWKIKIVVLYILCSWRPRPLNVKVLGMAREMNLKNTCTAVNHNDRTIAL